MSVEDAEFPDHQRPDRVGSESLGPVTSTTVGSTCP